MNIIFFGSSSYCLPVLESLTKTFKLVAVVTKPDGMIARKNTLPRIFTPASKTELQNLRPELEKLIPDIAVVADFGLIMPQEIIDIPTLGTINIHFSKLPDLRGASPVQYTILRGDKSAWITYMLMDKGLDTGNIIKQSEYKTIRSSDNPVTQSSGKLYDFLFRQAAKELPRVINDFINKILIPIRQDDAKAVYTKLLSREDGFIPWEIIVCAVEGTIPARDLASKWRLPKLFNPPLPVTDNQLPLIIERAVRAFDPWPGVWTKAAFAKRVKNTSGAAGRNEGRSHDSPDRGETEQKRLKILKAHIEKKTLVLDIVHLEGKKPVSWKQFGEAYRGLNLTSTSSSACTNSL